MRDKPKFSFSISDTAVFLGKAPVTLRSWERKNEFEFPRQGTDRRLNIDDVRSLAKWAKDRGRISDHRLKVVEATLTMMEVVENE